MNLLPIRLLPNFRGGDPYFFLHEKKHETNRNSWYPRPRSRYIFPRSGWVFPRSRLVFPPFVHALSTVRSEIIFSHYVLDMLSVSSKLIQRRRLRLQSQLQKIEL